MGWGRYFLFGDIGQQYDIRDLDDAIVRARTEQADTDRSQDEQLAELRALVGALVQVLVKRGGVTPAELAEAIREANAQPPRP